MREVFEKKLFEKNILVAGAESTAEETFAVLLALFTIFGIRVSGEITRCHARMVHLAEDILGKDVPEPFYRGFPDSVKELPLEMRILDQLLAYTKTYGMGQFNAACHSVFERETKRSPFTEKTAYTDFRVLPVKKAETVLTQVYTNLISSSRPLSESDLIFVTEYVKEYGGGNFAFSCKSIDTILKVAYRLEDPALAVPAIKLSDVWKLVETLTEEPPWIRLKNHDRKFVTRLIDALAAARKVNLEVCAEKRKKWCTLLHQLHYQPKTDVMRAFCQYMRNPKTYPNCSAYAEVERTLKQDRVEAARILLTRKGPGALLRNLDYLASRCESVGELGEILALLEHAQVSATLFAQLYLGYQNTTASGMAQREFVFVKNGQVCSHTETRSEADKRKTNLSAAKVEYLKEYIYRWLMDAVSKKHLGKVYLDPVYQTIAVPLQQAAVQGGYGTLPVGSRMPIPEGKKVRAFVYWEKVDDIDLSMFLLDEDIVSKKEISWRTAGSGSAAITFSGDETAGYQGGSEYFDLDLEKIQEAYGNTYRYAVLCGNVYTPGVKFSDCFCKGGYMLRDTDSSGEVYEPKTVKTAYHIDCNSRQAYLFAVDLKTRELIWLNLAKHTSAAVAGDASFTMLKKYLHFVEWLPVSDLITAAADDMVDTPEAADVWFAPADCLDGDVHPGDIEKLYQLLC